MTENEFQKKYLKDIKKVLDFAVNNNFSTFYKEKYQELDFDVTKISSYEEFKKIPFLTKDDILTKPITKRIFTNPQDIDRFTLSAGTISHNNPLVVPRTKAEILKINISSISNINIDSKKILVLFPPMASAFTSFIKVVERNNGIPISGDSYHLKKTALASKEIDIEGIITTPTILTFFAEELRATKFNLDKIEFISLGGEGTTTQRANYFRKIFPKAKIIFRYGASETGGLRGYRCKELFSNPPNFYHPANIFLEIIDETDNTLGYNTSGELVQTDLITPKAFPIIRYKTSDMGSLEKSNCKCGKNININLGGRANYDVLRFSGITLHTTAIENSLDEFRDKIQPNFQVHVFEELIGEKLMPKITLQLNLIDQKNQNTSILAEVIKKSVTNRLFLSTDKTLSYFVENNIFLPLEVKFVKLDKSKPKSKTIISHLI